MTTIKDLKKEFARAEKEANKISSTIAKAELNGKLKCVTDIVLHNEFLHVRISSMPTDEVKILLGEVMNSEEFTVLVKYTFENSARLTELRADKAAKAERRKLGSFPTKQTDCTENEGLF